MRLKININDSTTTFDDAQVGSVFHSCNSNNFCFQGIQPCFMKLGEIPGKTNDYCYFAVCLNDGSVWSFEKNEDIILVKAEMAVTE